jgi:hypothetical protein
VSEVTVVALALSLIPESMFVFKGATRNPKSLGASGIRQRYGGKV